MAGKDDDATPPGWYRQQEDPGTLRWWDGSDWTDDTMAAPPVAGERSKVRAAEAAASGSSSAPTVGRARSERAVERRVEAPPVAVPPAELLATSVVRSVPGQGRTRPADRRRPDQPSVEAPSEASQRPRSPRGRPGGEHRSPRPVPRSEADRAREVRAAPTADRRLGPRPVPRRHPGEGPPPQRMAGRTPPGRVGSGGAARPTGGPPGRARPGQRVVRRGPGVAPPVVRVGVRALLLAVVVGVVYFGYVQIRDAEPPPARTVPEEVPQVVEEEDARPIGEALLTLADLPQGWSAQTHEPAADDICHGRIPRSVIEPTEVASAAFTQGDAGPFITNTVARFADEQAAKDLLDLTETTVQSCREFEAEDTVLRLGPLDYPRFGDDTFVVAVSGDSPFGAISGAIVYVRVGNRVGSVETIAFGDTEISDALVERLANLLSRRL